MSRDQALKCMVLPIESEQFKAIVKRKGTTVSDALRLLVLEEIRKDEQKEGDRF